MDQPTAAAKSGDPAIAPPVPDLTDNEWVFWPELLIADKHLSIGWEARTERKGGRCYLVGRAAAIGEARVLKRFPATDYGWAEAWHFLVGHDPALVPRLRQKLADRAVADRRRAEVAELDALDQVAVRSVTLLGGHFTGADMPTGKRYDLRFLTDRLLVTSPGDSEPQLDIPYSAIQEVEVGGPGLVGAWSQGDPVGLTRALGIDSRVQTILRVSAAVGELFFLDSRTLPDALRIQLSKPLAAIRGRGGTAARAAATVSELRALASMLESGLLTRAEFDTLKSGLLSGQG